MRRHWLGHPVRGQCELDVRRCSGGKCANRSWASAGVSDLTSRSRRRLAAALFCHCRSPSSVARVAPTTDPGLPASSASPTASSTLIARASTPLPQRALRRGRGQWWRGGGVGGNVRRRRARPRWLVSRGKDLHDDDICTDDLPPGRRVVHVRGGLPRQRRRRLQRAARRQQGR
jgi:hypothetical protein